MNDEHVKLQSLFKQYKNNCKQYSDMLQDGHDKEVALLHVNEVLIKEKEWSDRLDAYRRIAQSEAKRQDRDSAVSVQECGDQARQVQPRAGPSRSRSLLRSTSSKPSTSISAKRAALLVEAAAMEEKEKIEQEILQLQQRAKRLEMKTELEKFKAEQRALEEEESENQSIESEGARKDRITAWLDTTCTPGGNNEKAEVNVLQNREKVGRPLDPLAPEFRVADQNHTSNGAIEEMIHTLHMPKADMMTFDGDAIKYWTFIKAFDNSVGKYNVDEHAKLARLLQYCKGRAYKVIESCAAMEKGGYKRARQLLHERFGDRINRVTSGAKVTTDSLQDFADELLSFRETLYAMDCLEEINQPVLVQIAEKLPVYLQHRWKRQAVWFIGV